MSHQESFLALSSGANEQMEGGRSTQDAPSGASELTRVLMLGITSFTASLSFVLIPAIFRLRRQKSIASSRWILLEMILIGSILLYGTVLVRYFDPASFPVTCLLDPWMRELGFGLFHGTLVIKLYRIQMEFQSRKAHRVLIRDQDLMKYLLVILIIIIGYLSAWTVLITHDFPRVYSASVTPGAGNQHSSSLSNSFQSSPQEGALRMAMVAPSASHHHPNLVHFFNFSGSDSREGDEFPDPIQNELFQEEGDFGLFGAGQDGQGWKRSQRKRERASILLEEGARREDPSKESSLEEEALNDEPPRRGVGRAPKLERPAPRQASSLQHLVVRDGASFHTCRHLAWDYVTQAGELAFLVTGIYLTYCIRNARREIYREKRVLCALIYLECAVSLITYISRHFYSERALDPNLTFYYLYFTRIQVTVTIPLLALLGPKLWIARECSFLTTMTSSPFFPSSKLQARPPSDQPDGGEKREGGANKPMAEGSGAKGGVHFSSTGAGKRAGANHRDEDESAFMDHVVHEMDPEEVRAELKKVYTQLQILRNKNMRKDNPHISKRRGGKKSAGSTNIRRFSLQPFGGDARGSSRKSASKKSAKYVEECSRSPEECSTASLEQQPQPDSSHHR